MLGARAVPQHRETGRGAAAAAALHPGPAHLAARRPWAPGAPGLTALLFPGGPCLPRQFTVRLPGAHLGRERGQGDFRFGGTVALPSAPPVPHPHQLETEAEAIRVGVFWAGKPCPVGASWDWQPL